MSKAGIYIHIPFCIQKCGYCDFYSVTDMGLIPSFTAALVREIQLRSRPQAICDTLYLGGGTPSLLDRDALAKILKTIGQHFLITEDVEVTLEANPATISFNKITDLHHMGLNRINIGVQSFWDRHLKLLGRIHTVKDAHESISMARKAGFKRLGVDLIYGLPGQTEDMWQKDLKAALSYFPEHISCYMLTYESKTPMDKERQRGAIIPLDEGKVADLFEFTAEFLCQNGYDHYEISNFARKDPGFDYRSRHNRKYWNGAPYFGFGPAAHSFESPLRAWNPRDVTAYIKNLSQNRLPVAETETLSFSQQRLEAIYLGLRQSDGIDLAAFEKRFKERLPVADLALLQRLQTEKMVVYDNTTLALTVKGMRYLDSIAPLI
jgi:putative oxygen-independent coproporphyrinogen III oxidase